MKLKVTSGTHVALYADDTKIWREIKEYIYHLILPNDISALLQWSIDNKMSFHPAKCKVLKVTRQTEKFMDKFLYRLGNSYLDYMNQDRKNEKEKFEKDLGIIVIPNLTWDTHCEMLIRRANSRLGLTKRTCHFVKNRKQRLVLYQTMVRSIFSTVLRFGVQSLKMFLINLRLFKRGQLNGYLTKSIHLIRIKSIWRNSMSWKF